METSSGLQAQPLDAGELRKRSVGTVEFQDEKGRRRTVQLDELNEADRALAEQFGYKPVREYWLLTREKQTNIVTGLQTRVRLPLYLLVRRQYLRSLLHDRDDFLLSALRRWLRVCSLVLAHFWCRMYVHCLLGR